MKGPVETQNRKVVANDDSDGCWVIRSRRLMGIENKTDASSRGWRHDEARVPEEMGE